MFPQLKEQAINVLSTIQLQPLGTVVYTDNGRKGFKYVLFGGTTTITSGKLLVAAAAPTNSTGLAVPTSNTTANLSSGSKTILVTNGATAVTANQFADGTLEVLGTNGGQSYVIAGNTSDAGSGTLTITLVEGLRNAVALANGTNTVNLRQSSAYQANVSTTQADPVGVTIMAVPNTASVANYGWVQIFGPAFVAATSGTKGFPAVQDTATTAGNVANTGSNLPQLGVFREAVASSFATVDLDINN